MFFFLLPLKTGRQKGGRLDITLPMYCIPDLLCTLEVVGIHSSKHLRISQHSRVAVELWLQI